MYRGMWLTDNNPDPPVGGHLLEEYASNGWAWLFDRGNFGRLTGGTPGPWNHYGQGYNVLFVDGHLWWLSDPNDSHYNPTQTQAIHYAFYAAIDGN